MVFKRNLPNRKSIRLKGWDYRNPGYYFITICTEDRRHHFGRIRNGIMGLSVPGCVAWHYWRQIPNHQPRVVPDAFVVMPDHLHGIIGIRGKCPANKFVGTCDGNNSGTLHATSAQNDDEMSRISPDPGSLSVIIRSYKSALTRWCNRNGHEDFAWQSRFHDHIIRNQMALDRIRQYIFDNPKQWQWDVKKASRAREQDREYRAA